MCQQSILLQTVNLVSNFLCKILQKKKKKVSRKMFTFYNIMKILRGINIVLFNTGSF